jgi:outer membrane protein OmpA-like peptidoglycan-associated protein
MRVFLLLLAFSLLMEQPSEAQIRNDTDSAKLIIEFTDPQQNPLSNRMLVVTNQGSDDQEFKGKTDENGKVVIRVPKGNQYQVVYRAVDGPVEFQAFEIPDKRGRLTFTFNPQYDRRVGDRTYTLRDVYFNTDKATLRESSYDALNDLVAAMRTNKAMQVEIAGHTDDRASAKYNRDLSQRRAESVKAYLVENGIAEGRIEAKGYGEAEPVASNETEEGRQKNRRVEVRILEQ